MEKSCSEMTGPDVMCSRTLAKTSVIKNIHPIGDKLCGFGSEKANVDVGAGSELRQCGSRYDRSLL